MWEARHSGRITGGEAKRAYLWLYMDRLADLGYKHLLVRPINVQGRNELYAMIFVTDSLAGQSIMKWAQEKKRVRPEEGTLLDIPREVAEYEDLHTGWREEIRIELPPWTEL